MFITSSVTKGVGNWSADTFEFNRVFGILDY